MRKSIVEEIKPDALDLVRARRSDFWGRLRKVEELLRLVEVRVDELSRARSMTFTHSGNQGEVDEVRREGRSQD